MPAERRADDVCASKAELLGSGPRRSPAMSDRVYGASTRRTEIAAEHRRDGLGHRGVEPCRLADVAGDRSRATWKPGRDELLAQPSSRTRAARPMPMIRTSGRPRGRRTRRTRARSAATPPQPPARPVRAAGIIRRCRARAREVFESRDVRLGAHGSSGQSSSGGFVTPASGGLLALPASGRLARAAASGGFLAEPSPGIGLVTGPLGTICRFGAAPLSPFSRSTTYSRSLSGTRSTIVST